MKRSCLLGAALLCCLLGAAEPFALVKNGKAVAVLQVAKEEPPVVQHAALELAAAAQKLTGAKVKIVRNRVPGPALVLSSKMLPGIPQEDFDALKKSGSDGYSFRITGDKAYLFAANAKGVFSGANRLLRLNTKLIYPRPTMPEGVCARTKDLTFAEKGVDIPSYYYRTLSYNPAHDPKSGLQMARWNIIPSNVRPQDAKRFEKRLVELGNWDTYFNPYMISHNMVGFWMPVAEYGKAHPEYYMMVDGKRIVNRRAHPCVSNPAVVEVYRKRAREIVSTLPKCYTEFGLMMEDTNLRCECPGCTAPIKLADGSEIGPKDPAYFSTLFMRFFNEVAKEVAKLRPDLTMRIFGYYALAIPPKVPVEPNIKVNWCPYPRDMKQSLFFGDHNKKWRGYFDGYTKLTSKLILREYYYCGLQAFPRPLMDVAVRDLRYANEKGVRQFYSDYHGSDEERKDGEFMASAFWDLSAPEVWVLSELLWDVSGDPRELRHEFLRRAYPQGGAEHMIRFYDMIDDAWLKSPASSSYNDDPVALTKRYVVETKLTEPCRKALSDALKAEKNPASRKLIERASALFEKMVLLAGRGQSGELAVPETRKGEKIDWAKAPQILPWGLLRAPKEPGKTQIDARVACDNSAWYFRFDVRKEKGSKFVMHVKPGSAGELFPSGDHVELSFENEKAGYYQFAVDANGTKWDCRSGDTSWNGTWSADVKKGKNAWQITIRMPFSTIGFEPLKIDSVRTGVMVVGTTPTGRSEIQCWGAGRPQSPDSWSKLKMQLQIGQ